MRVQELYNQYCKKEITAEAFLRQMRINPLLKEYISPVNSVNDVILILKQRVGITEQVTNEDMVLQEKDVSSYEDEKGEPMPDSKEYGEKLEEDYRDEEFYEELDEKYGNPEIRKILADSDDLGFDLPGAAMNAILTHKDWAERWDIQDPSDIDKIRAWRDEVIKKAKANRKPMNEAKKEKKSKVTVDQINPYEFRKGWKYEYENTPSLQKDQNVDKAKEIALRNVAKDPNYYTNLFSKKPGDKDKKAPKKDESIPAAKNIKNNIELKDKANQMKNVNKGKEKSNVTSSNKERAKGKPKGVKVMKLKEEIRKELKSLLKEGGKLKEELTTFDDIKNTADKLLKQYGGDKKKAIERCDYALDVIKKDPSGTDRSKSKDLFTKVKAHLLGHKDLPVKPEKDAFSNNESVEPSSDSKLELEINNFLKIFDGDKNKVIDTCKKILKTLDKDSGNNIDNKRDRLNKIINLLSSMKESSTNERVTVGNLIPGKSRYYLLFKIH
jgi:hypothetical protein